MTEPFFVKLNMAYHNSLERFLKKRWQALLIILASFGLIVLLFKTIKSELSPLDNHSVLRLTASAPEGSSYEYMDNYMSKMTQYALDSISEKNIILTVVAPGFTGSGAVNTGFMRIVLTNPTERKRSHGHCRSVSERGK